jgi:hypothetical protein
MFKKDLPPRAKIGQKDHQLSQIPGTGNAVEARAAGLKAAFFLPATKYDSTNV